ncbi:hypothetical protein IW262DRAFT_1469585 [Armillaria fumosa]|nr:hypothetical protein IW262DRAFT_1469585 [Armillaria fumosa]
MSSSMRDIDLTVDEHPLESSDSPIAGPSHVITLHEPPSPPPIPVSPKGHPKQNIILLKRLHDLLPSKPTGFHLFASLEQKPPEPIYLETAPNKMGLYRCYKEWPSVDPIIGSGLNEVSDASMFTSHADHITDAPELSTNPFYPFPNVTIFRLFAWFYQSTSKSLSDVTSLVRTVLRASDFDPEHLTDNFDAVKEIKVLDVSSKQQNCLPFSLSDGWHKMSVTIKLSQTGVEHTSEESAPKFEVTGIYHRNLLDMIVSAFQSTAFLDFHLKGFKEMWDPGNGDRPERVYGEVYSSDIFLEMEDEVSLKLDPNGLETVIAPCMLYLDSTHLTNFSTAALWPIYLLFSLLSKYVRARPTLGASHHLMYMPTIPDKIQDAYLKYFGWHASPAILTFLKWELIHAIWAKLLSPEFMDAYINGVNAFSSVFLSLFNFYQMFVIDPLHEIELRTWKALFIHLLHLCQFYEGDIIQELNRRFKNNVSDLKNFTARDYEDILQCAMPCFEGLFPPKLDRLVLDLLFLFACWHANAKLWMYTESLLQVFECLTWLFASFMRKFKQEVDEIDTHEIPKEHEARAWHDIANMKKKGNGSSKGKVSTVKLQKRFNLSTYKNHAMGDYPEMIRAFGTTDSYSTQVGELEHRRVKCFYRWTNKNKTFAKQISLHVQCQECLQEMQQKIDLNDKKHQSRPMPAKDHSKLLPYTDPSHHHHISPSTSSKIYLAPWLHENDSNIACTGFIRKLKDHLLSQILDSNDEFTDLHRQNLIIIDNCLYSHQILRINYTTYDAHWNQDSINPHTHSDIMTLSPSTEADLDSDNDVRPYLYARVIGIFHATVQWYAFDSSIPSGFRAKHLPCIGFLAGDDPQAFGFVDPNNVLRASHVMPAYIYGQTSDILPPSICRRYDENDMDWAHYYVDIFVDRDMFMQYCGNGVGHGNTQEYTRGLWEELLDALEITTESGNTSEAAELDIEEDDDEEPGDSTLDNSGAESDCGSIEDEDSDSSWQSEDYVELDEPEEDDEFDDDGVFGYSAL